MTRMATLLLLAGCLACGRAPATTPAPQTIDPSLEAWAADTTAITEPMQVVFDWNLRDRDARFSGQGVARIEQNRARVDLFGPRGEGYLSAVLDGFQLSLSSGSPENVPLPPPALFWSVLGVFRAPPGASLVSAVRDGNEVELSYAASSDRWRFRFENDDLRHAEWTGSAEGRRTVELDAPNGDGLPAGAIYRDWPAFLELRLTPTETRKVNGFPGEIWTLRRR
ncbi:MAG TPA: hypothetical protein VNK41_10375 [Vicinamibacterales bacterium]|nr:hypothetical protein [Vicinamibacterales bacterium]